MKWRTLRHNGVLFPPEYVPQGIKFKIKGEDVELTPLQEEMVYQWAKKKDTPYAKDRTFCKNFATDFAATFKPRIKFTYKHLDFAHAYSIIDREKEAKLLMTKEEKKELAAKRKAVREEMRAKYGSAKVDGKRVDLGNYMVEPPGIFIGRGKHPFRGRWKPRVYMRDVILNMDKKARPPSGKWRGVGPRERLRVGGEVDRQAHPQDKVRVACRHLPAQAGDGQGQIRKGRGPGRQDTRRERGAAPRHGPGKSLSR